MKRQTIHQVVPAMIMAGAAAIPVLSTVEILTHISGSGGLVVAQPGVPVAVPPSLSASTSRGSTVPTGVGKTHTYPGPVISDPFGGVRATVTVTAKKITGVSITAPLDNPRSASINQQAVPLLRSETLRAQSAQVNIVSGATLTSQAYAQSLQAALSQAQSAGNAPATGRPGSRSGNSAAAGTSQIGSVSNGGDD